MRLVHKCVRVSVCVCVYVYVYIYREREREKERGRERGRGGTKIACALYNFCGNSTRFSKKQISSNVAWKKMRKFVVLCN